MSFLHGILFFFINSFLLFPSHIKRIILFSFCLDDHQPSFVYPSLQEESLQPPYVVDVDLISLPQPIHKDDFCIQISLESDQPCNLEEIEAISKPIHISSPFAFTIEPSNQLVYPHDQPTAFQTKIRMKLFKPSRLTYPLHPYPLDYLEYLP
jgi:hypothetical protein